jgi:omega-6 fatty acid desaturase (delta-12 desaturase)
LSQQSTKSEWRKNIKPYENTDLKHSVWQMVNTLIPFFILWYVAYLSLSISYAITLILSVVAGGFLVRIFIIFHDCCHKSFFNSRMANNILGVCTGILTFFPYHKWANEHNIHHATSANLDKRGTGDIWTLTITEYISSSWLKRFTYRLYRNPILMFGLGPTLVFLIQNRFNRKGAKLKERLNTYFTNISLVFILGILCWVIGWQSFLLIEIPIFLISGAAGVWLFFIQHTFEDSYFEREAEWCYVKAAMEGSSFYKLPSVLRWMTGNIGFHHIHHLSSRIPNYNLQKVHEQNPIFQQTKTITLMKSLESIKMCIWDEGNKKFITFKEASKY